MTFYSATALIRVFHNWYSYEGKWKNDASDRLGNVGSKSARVTDDTGDHADYLVKRISTEGKSNLRIEFWYKIAENISNGDFVEVRWRPNHDHDTDWRSLAGARIENESQGDWKKMSVSFPSDAEDHHDFEFSFAASLKKSGSQDKDEVRIDDLNLVYNYSACTPSTEICDGVDNDCDGQIDENLSRSTGQSGLCSDNTEVCSAGQWSASQSNYQPTAETCDNKDNDCDGQADENLSRPSLNQSGLCSGNTESCSAGRWVGNESNYQPTAEICDAQDNDCNGQTDEVFPVGDKCTVGLGACAATGSYQCADNEAGYACGATAGTPAVEACDGIDNDCDGLTDEDGVCDVDPICGDGVVNRENEQCDGSELSHECTTGDGYAGEQSCNTEQCTWNETCVTNERCGDGIKNGNEQCDGSTDLPNKLCNPDCKLIDQTYSIHGYKWNDQNGDSEFDCHYNNDERKVCEEKLGNWTIFLDDNENGKLDENEVSTTTATEGEDTGWYRFEGLLAGNYRVCEVNQRGWTGTYPAETNCHNLTLPADTAYTQNGIYAPEYDFGNRYSGYCGDGIVQQSREEQCDGTAGEIPSGYHCTDQCTIEKNQEEHREPEQQGGGAVPLWLLQLQSQQNKPPAGQVLGEKITNTDAASSSVSTPEICGEYITEYIYKGKNNNGNVVKKLQSFLNEFMGEKLSVSGLYNRLTIAAVNRFQLKYTDEVLRPWVAFGLPLRPTGIVYKTTRYQINRIKCGNRPMNFSAPVLP